MKDNIKIGFFVLPDPEDQEEFLENLRELLVEEGIKTKAL